MEHVREKKLLGQQVRKVREARGISQRRLALMTGTSRSYLWKIEMGAADVGIDVLVRLADALGVTVRELVSF